MLTDFFYSKIKSQDNLLTNESKIINFKAILKHKNCLAFIKILLALKFVIQKIRLFCRGSQAYGEDKLEAKPLEKGSRSIPIATRREREKIFCIFCK